MEMNANLNSFTGNVAKERQSDVNEQVYRAAPLNEHSEGRQQDCQDDLAYV